MSAAVDAATTAATAARVPNVLRLADTGWVRAVAATEVLVWHSDLITKHFSAGTIAAPLYRPFGAIGVEIFFVLSGYIMCMRAPEYAGGARYLLARLTRLTPLYWLFTSLVILAYFVNRDWHLGGFELNPDSIAASYLMLPVAGFPILMVGWTLAYEMIFYGLVALLAAGGGYRGRAGPLALFGVVFACGIAGLMQREVNPTDVGVVGHLLSPYLLNFAFGWLIRYAEDNDGLLRQWRLIGCVLAIFALTWSQAGPEAQRLAMRIAIAAGCVLLFRAARPWLSRDNRINRAGCLIGASSYSLYLSHWFVLSVLGKAIAPFAPSAEAPLLRGLGIVLCLFVGLAVYLLIEQPTDRFLRRRLLRPARPKTRSAQAAATTF